MKQIHIDAVTCDGCPCFYLQHEFCGLYEQHISAQHKKLAQCACDAPQVVKNSHVVNFAVIDNI